MRMFMHVYCIVLSIISLVFYILVYMLYLAIQPLGCKSVQ